jgi:hypothetical protein
MVVTISVTRVGTGARDLRVNIFQDSPVWQNAGRTLDGLASADVVQLLRALGMSIADSQELVESAEQAQFSARRRQLQLNAVQQEYADRTFPPL